MNITKQFINESTRIAWRNDVTSTQLDIVKACFFRYWTIDGVMHELTANTNAELLEQMKAL